MYIFSIGGLMGYIYIYMYINTGGLLGYIYKYYIYPKKLQISAHGQFFLILSKIEAHGTKSPRVP